MVHTKGEWALFKGSKTEGYCGDSGITFEVWYGKDNQYEEAKANAKLIAAAPELLDTLGAILDVSRGYGVMNESWMQERIEQAIKKATQ